MRVTALISWQNLLAAGGGGVVIRIIAAPVAPEGTVLGGAGFRTDPAVRQDPDGAPFRQYWLRPG